MAKAISKTSKKRVDAAVQAFRRAKHEEGRTLPEHREIMKDLERQVRALSEGEREMYLTEIRNGGDSE